MCFVFIIAIILSVYIALKDTRKQFCFEMDICSENGITSYLIVDAELVDNGIDPIHYRGTVSVDGVEYIDHISRLYSIKTSILERIKERWRGISYYDFFFPRSGSFKESIEMILFYDEQGQMYVNLRHWGDSSVVDYFGPSKDGETSKSIKEKFDMYILSEGKISGGKI